MQPGYTHRTVLFDGLQSAKAVLSRFWGVGVYPDDVTLRMTSCQVEHGGSLNFSAYRQGRDRQEPNVTKTGGFF